MWCLTLTSGARSFHATEAAAVAAANGAEHVVWFDSFDYERHNPGESVRRYAERVETERATGLAFVHELGAALRRRLGLQEAS